MNPVDWEWLQDGPEQWSLPSDIAQPNKSEGVDLAIAMLSSGALGNDLIDLAGQLASEWAKFNVRVARASKSGELSIVETFQRAQSAGEQLRKIYESWKVFEEARDRSGRTYGAFEKEYGALRYTLRASVEEIARL